MKQDREGLHGDELLLRPREAARVLALSRSTVYAMIASGELAVVRVGRTLRVPAKALRDWVDMNAAISPARDGEGERRTGGYEQTPGDNPVRPRQTNIEEIKEDE